MKTRKQLFLVPIIAVLVASCSGNEPSNITQVEPVKVIVNTALGIRNNKSISVSGKIEAHNSANISTRMMGNITSVKVVPGAKVQKGDLLLTINSSALSAKKAQVQSSIVQAESTFQNAKKDYERFQILHQKGSASEKELENISTQFQVAEAGLNAALEMKNEVEAQFSYTHIKAPFSGIVSNTFAKEGDIAHPGMPLVTVEGTNNYEAVVLIPESQINSVKLGARANVHVKSIGLKYNGIVKEISPSSKNTGGQYIAKITIENSEKLLPGMYANVELETESDSSSRTSPMVDVTALSQTGQLTSIYTLTSDKTAILRWVRTGKTVNDKVEILSGIKEGEQYIVTADGRLYNGVPIQL